MCLLDVHRDNLGWDIESAIPNSGKLRFIEVKGRIEGAETITVSKNEILAGLNKPESFLLAVVEIGFELEQAKQGLRIIFNVLSAESRILLPPV